MATLTSTAVANNRVRAVHAGVNSMSVNFNSNTTQISPSQTTILMARLPDQAHILDVIGYVSSGAATCPWIAGIQDPANASATLSAIVASGTTGTVTRANVGNMPLTVSASDDVLQYKHVTVSVTPGTATASVKVDLTVLYTMDK